jgi:hypothetical protein
VSRNLGSPSSHIGGKESNNRQSKNPPYRSGQFPVFTLLFCIAAILVPASCGAPGEPTARRTPVPEPVTDLSAQQVGNDIILGFSMPKDMAWQEPISTTPTINIYRDFTALPPAGAPPVSAPQTLLATIPPQMVDHYLQDGRVKFVSSMKPDEMADHAGQDAIFSVRTYISSRKPSENSNIVALQIYPPPEPIRGVTADVTPMTIVLKWPAPQSTTAGGNLSPLDHYAVYRAELSTSEAAAAPASAEQLKVPLQLIGEPTTPIFEDTQFEFGHTYVYSVRSVIRDGTDLVESSDSELRTVTPRNTFPPPAPEGLVVVYVPATANTPAHLELTWNITNETDVAGYNVYSHVGNAPAQRVNTSLILAPAFRDFSTRPGETYIYTVTTVDSAGNESPPSAPVSGNIP